MRPSRKRAPIGFGTGSVASGVTFDEASGRSPASRGAAEAEAGASAAKASSTSAPSGFMVRSI
jgi:hypothetical protein